MATIALEFVPPEASQGSTRALEQLHQVRSELERTDLLSRVNTLLIPGMIQEDPDRPIELHERLDVLDIHRLSQQVLSTDSIVTQVSAFSSPGELEARVEDIRAAGVDRVVFVGVPRTLTDGEGSGATPTQAVELYRDRFASRGVILIPTRDQEAERFASKLGGGANLALCQLLFSDRVASVLTQVPSELPKPEVLISLGYVAKAEERTGLIQWLIRDETSAAQREMEIVRKIAPLGFAEKKRALVDIYRSIVEAVGELGYPIGLHFECPYGFSPYAFDVFQAMLDVWAPDT